MRAFGSGDELNHLFGAAEPILNLVGISTERFHGELGCDARFGEPGVFRHEPNFVYAYARGAILAEVSLEAVTEGRCLGAGLHKGPNEVGELFAVHGRSEAD